MFALRTRPAKPSAAANAGRSSEPFATTSVQCGAAWMPMPKPWPLNAKLVTSLCTATRGSAAAVTAVAATRRAARTGLVSMIAIIYDTHHAYCQLLPCTLAMPRYDEAKKDKIRAHILEVATRMLREEGLAGA